MATKTKTREQSGRADDRSPFTFGGQWSGKDAGVLMGAAVAGAAVGFAANMGRKLFVQFATAPGDWVDSLKREHEMALAIFDKIEATDDSQTVFRATLLAKLKYALTKHALEEENVVYPALREAGQKVAADKLNAEHGEVKTYLYELENLATDDPAWMDTVRAFRADIEAHMREEENEIFPSFRSRMTDEQNAKLTAAMNKEGFHYA